jgi:hypothetical protein
VKGENRNCQKGAVLLLKFSKLTVNAPEITAIFYVGFRRLKIGFNPSLF